MPAGVESDLLGTGDLEALALLQRADEFGRLDQRIRRAGVEPGEAAAEPLDLQLAALQIEPVEVGDLQFAARRGLQRSRRMSTTRSS